VFGWPPGPRQEHRLGRGPVLGRSFQRSEPEKAPQGAYHSHPEQVRGPGERSRELLRLPDPAARPGSGLTAARLVPVPAAGLHPLWRPGMLRFPRLSLQTSSIDERSAALLTALG